MKLEAARAKLTDSKERPNGELRVQTTPGIGIHWLTPRLGEFIDLYPDIHITLITTDEELDLAMRERRGDPATPADAAQPDPAQMFSVRFTRLCPRGIHQQFARSRALMISTIAVFCLSAARPCPIISRTGAWLIEVCVRNRTARASPRSRSTMSSVTMRGQRGIGVALLPVI